MDEILARTDGVPLFIEELTKTVLESAHLQERDGHYVLSTVRCRPWRSRPHCTRR